jgi:kanamycin nucleotidyltransferase
MLEGPLALSHNQRMEVVDRIIAESRALYGTAMLAVGLYGSMGRWADGPHSDIELFFVIDQPGLDLTLEWVYGAGKAEANYYGPDVVRRHATRVKPCWALAQGEFYHVRPLWGDVTFFQELKEGVMSPGKDEFSRVICEMIVGELYEWVGKLRNARAANVWAGLPALACAFTEHVALMLGLAHKHIFTSGSTLLQEAQALPNRPAGFDELSAMVLAGDLADAEQVTAAMERAWQGVIVWAQRLEIGLERLQRWPIPMVG